MLKILLAHNINVFCLFASFYIYVIQLQNLLLTMILCELQNITIDNDMSEVTYVGSFRFLWSWFCHMSNFDTEWLKSNEEDEGFI